MLRIAMLSLLADSDYSGYDLSKAFDRSITYVWAASQSQIYPELHKLEAKGLIAGSDVPQDGRPDKRVYRITDAGRATLVAWVQEPPTALSIRDPFQLQVINFGRLDAARARALVEQQRSLMQQRLDVLRHIRDTLEATGHAPGEPWGDQLGWRLTVEAGLRTAQAYVEWCDWTVTQLAASAGRRSAPTTTPIRP
jgi:PadR family transcriptional regulator AphA